MNLVATSFACHRRNGCWSALSIVGFGSCVGLFKEDFLASISSASSIRLPQPEYIQISVFLAVRLVINIVRFTLCMYSVVDLHQKFGIYRLSYSCTKWRRLTSLSNPTLLRNKNLSTNRTMPRDDRRKHQLRIEISIFPIDNFNYHEIDWSNEPLSGWNQIFIHLKRILPFKAKLVLPRNQVNQDANDLRS